MTINIYHSQTFTRVSKRFKKKFKSFDDDIDTFTNTIGRQNADNLGNNVFKYRLAVKSKNKGKSGGFRVMTLEIIVCKDEKNITLLTVYDKSEQQSISKKEIEQIIQEI